MRFALRPTRHAMNTGSYKHGYFHPVRWNGKEGEGFYAVCVDCATPVDPESLCEHVQFHLLPQMPSP